MSNLYDNSQLKTCGDDVWIFSTVSIRRPQLISLGSHVSIDEYFVQTAALEVGDYVHISTHVSIIGGAAGLLRLGNFTNIATKGTIICVSDTFNGDGIVSAPNLPDEYHGSLINEPVIFEDFANIGANVTILPGVTLPQGVVIGACSLVRKKDVLKPWTIYAGNPLREIRPRPKEIMFEYAKKLGYN